MLNTGKKNILTLVLSEKRFLDETKNHSPSLQVKWSVPYVIDYKGITTISSQLNNY